MLTQEFLAQMLCVQRTSVTITAGELQKKGLITYARGRLRIENIELVQQRVCECHGAVREHYNEIFKGKARSACTGRVPQEIAEACD